MNKYAADNTHLQCFYIHNAADTTVLYAINATFIGQTDK